MPRCVAIHVSTDCKHEEFSAKVAVQRLEDTRQFVAEVQIECSRCKLPFHFLGLQPGLDLGGAMVSIDGLEARLAIAPKGSVPNPIHRMGFGVQKFDG